MLRASVEATGSPIDLAAVTDPLRDPLLPAATELRCLIDAVVLRDSYERDLALNSLIDAVGPDGAIRAAATIGNFEMMNRLLDGIGVGPTRRSAQIAPALGIQWYD